MKTYSIKTAALLILISSFSLTGCQHSASTTQSNKQVAPIESTANNEGQMFGWPFATGDQLKIRGGTTTGGPVVLDLEISDTWKSLQERGISKQERDRRAILAMTGDYRVSFQFVEVAGMEGDYTRPKPYFSWSTERVTVLENSPDFISLQHTLVMFIQQDDGSVSDPILVKHWRQDWDYQDTQVHAYATKRQWQEQTLSPQEVAGKWSQTVYQVDDSPRYEVVGEWVHGSQLSTWQSNLGKRPIPRREYSARDDYDLLEGWNTITIYPTGWLHEQSNFKLALANEKQQSRYIAKETGINRYDRITSPSLDEAAAYWERTGAYWAEVRDVWHQIYAENSRFGLRAKVDEEKLYQIHFAYAADIESAEAYDPVEGSKHAKDTINKFLLLGDKLPSEKGNAKHKSY